MVFRNVRESAAKLGQSQFVRNTATLGGANFVAQAATLVVAPILTRLFSPDEFGVFAVFMSLAGIWASISCGGYDRAIVLPAEDQDARSLARLCGLVLAGSVLACLIAVGFLSAQLARLFATPALARWALVIPFLVLLTAGTTLGRNWLVRVKEFRAIAVVTVLTAATIAILRIGLGLAGVGVGALIGGTLLGILAGFCYLWWKVLGSKEWKESEIDLWPATRVSALEYKKFPMYRSPAILLNAGAQEGIVLLLAALYSPAVVGLYHFSKRLLYQPSTVIGTAVNDVYLQRAARQTAGGMSMLGNFKKISIALALLGSLPFSLVAFFGPALFSLVFGEKWREAGVYAQILSPWLFLIFVNQPANAIFTTLQKLGAQLSYFVTVTVARLAAILVGFFVYDSAVVSIMFFSAVSVVFSGVFFAMAYSFAKRHDEALYSEPQEMA